MTKKEILCIHYYFPPIKSVATIRNFNTSTEYTKYFSKVNIVTTTNSNLLGQERFDTSQFKVLKLKTFDYRTIAFLFSKEKKTHHSASKKGIFSSLIVKLNLSFPTNLIWGEGGLLYIFNGYNKGKQILAKGNVSHIYSSFMPYSDHVIAYLLKKKFPDIFWVADFRDLHIKPSERTNIFNSFQKWCNRKILSKANLVTTVSNGLAENLKTLHPNIFVVRNAIPTAVEINNLSSKNRSFTISYTGSVYLEYQSPELLLQCIYTLIEDGAIKRDKIRFVYAGKDTHAWRSWFQKYRLEEIFIGRGLVSYQEAINIQKSSDCNLLLSWSSSKLKGILTGKVYEYFVANRPIINLINGVRDEEFEDIFSELNAGKIFYPNSETELKKYILKLYITWKLNGYIEGQINKSNVRNFYWDKQTERLLNKISSLEKQ